MHKTSDMVQLWRLSLLIALVASYGEAFSSPTHRLSTPTTSSCSLLALQLQSHNKDAFDADKKERGLECPNSNSMEISARQARILTPLLAALAALGAASASPLSASAALSSPDIPSFFSSLRKYFPGALPSSVLAGKALSALQERGVRSDNVIVGTSFCGDGTSNDVYTRLAAELQVTKADNLAGLAAIPFAGPSGFNAFFASMPSGSKGKKKVLLVYGPTVGISEGGDLIQPKSATSSTDACDGAILRAFQNLKADAKLSSSDFGSGGGGLEGIEKAYLQKELRKRLYKVDFAAIDDRDLDVQNDIMAKVVTATYDIISDLLLKEVDAVMQAQLDKFWDDVSEIVMLGGVTITQSSGRGGFGQYFQPIVFQSQRKTPGQTFVVTDNLLDSLIDSKKKTADTGPKASVSSMLKVPVPDGIALPPIPSVEAPNLGNIDASDESIQKAAAAFGGATIVGGAIAAAFSKKGGSPKTVAVASSKPARPRPPEPRIAHQIQNKKETKKSSKSGFFSGLLPGPKPPKLKSNPATESLISTLIPLSEGTDRGQFASKDARETANSLIAGLEAMSPLESPTTSSRIEGTWELIYATNNLVTSSPFFLARLDQSSAVGETGAYTNCIQNLGLGSIGSVRQIVSQDSLISEIELGADKNIQGAIVTKANIEPAFTGRAWGISLSSVELRSSEVSVVRQLLDIKSGKAVPGGDLVPGSRAVLETTYLDDSYRISRDREGGTFVFKRVSDKTLSTDYSKVKDITDQVLKIL